MDDLCVSSYLSALVCFTTHVQYMLFWQLEKEGAPVRFLSSEVYDAEVVRPQKAMDPGLTPGSLHAQSEARYEAFVSAQPMALGNNMIGASGEDLEVELLSSDIMFSSVTVRQVLLEPALVFRDHVLLKDVRLHFSHMAAAGEGQLDSFLQLRLYRP